MAVCERLAAAGDRVVVADLDAAPAEALAGTLTGGGHLGLAMDVADTDRVRDTVARVAAELGPVDVLVNVAGWDRFVPFVDTNREFWDQVIAVNYRGPLNTAHAVIPSMIERGRGRIVSVASDAARVGSSLETIYSGAKGAWWRSPRAWPARSPGTASPSTWCAPGPTDTPLIRSMADDLGSGERFMDALVRAIPMRRLGRPMTSPRRWRSSLPRTPASSPARRCR